MAWRDRISKLKAEMDALHLCAAHPRVPWYAKAFAAFLVGYAVSPIDLIPDFIPVIGHLDDAILLPLGFYLLIRMIPKDVLAECREQARANKAG